MIALKRDNQRSPLSEMVNGFNFVRWHRTQITLRAQNPIHYQPDLSGH